MSFEKTMEAARWTRHQGSGTASLPVPGGHVLSIRRLHGEADADEAILALLDDVVPDDVLGQVAAHLGELVDRVAAPGGPVFIPDWDAAAAAFVAGIKPLCDAENTASADLRATLQALQGHAAERADRAE